MNVDWVRPNIQANPTQTEPYPGGYREEIGEVYEVCLCAAQDFGYWGGDLSIIYVNEVGLPIGVM